MTENFDIFDLDGCGAELVFFKLYFPCIIEQVKLVQWNQSSLSCDTMNLISHYTHRDVIFVILN